MAAWLSESFLIQKTLFLMSVQKGLSEITEALLVPSELKMYAWKKNQDCFTRDI